MRNFILMASLNSSSSPAWHEMCAEAEKGKPWYDPTLRFVLIKVSSREDTDDKTLKTVTVELSQKTSQKVSFYEYDGVETFLKMQKMHEHFLSQQDVRKKHAKLDKLDNEVLKKIDTIPEDSTDKLELETWDPQESRARPSVF